MWDRITVVFKLKSPVHIGYLPFKGSVVSPTRYYIPGRNFWGAITKRVTEYLFQEPSAQNYRQIGEGVMNNFVFSYFYVYNSEEIYFPRYTDEGLKFGDDTKLITKPEFEYRFVSSLISTAIDSDSLTAKDETLHEIEFINNKFKDKDGNIKNVKIAGCVWIKKGAKIHDRQVKIGSKIAIDDFDILEELIVGGESKYGFGYIAVDSINKVDFSMAPFSWENPEQVIIAKKDFLVGHLRYNQNIKFKGEIEILTGRGYYDPKNPQSGDDKPGKTIYKPDYYFSPGTCIISENKQYALNWDGSLEIKFDKIN